MRLNNCEKGRSMVEMIGYMSVAMTVIVAVGKMVTNVFNEHKFSQASIQLSDLATAISKAGAMEKDYSQIDFNKYLPSSFRTSGNKIFHVFGGTVRIGVLNDEKDKFTITFDGLRKRQCIELGMKDWRHNQNVDLYSVGVNNTFLYWPVYKINTEPSESLPMTRVKLTGKGEGDKGLCNLDTGNIITWVFN